MKNKVLYFALLTIMLFSFSSCEKESLGLTDITYYADIQLLGETSIIVNKGDNFEDPGFKATINGKDVSSQVTVKSNVDTSESGIYSIVYSMTNEDGFESSVTRTIIVLDLTDPIEGIWGVTPTSFRIYDGGAPVAYGDSFEFLVINRGSGDFFIEDLMAGWYAQRAGYGSNYAMQALVNIADDGTITLKESQVPGWGDSADDLKNGKYDAATSTITYNLFYAEKIEFDVTLNKVL